MNAEIIAMTSSNNIKKMNKVERTHATKSGTVFAKARQAALDRGLSITLSEGDKLVRVSPDGARKILKRISIPRSVKKNTKIDLR